MRGRITLVRRLPEPRDRFLLVLRHALAVGENHAQLLLRIHEPLRRRLAQPCDGLLLVLRVAFAVLVHQADPVLRFGVALFGERSQFLRGGGVVLLAHRVEAFVESGETEAC